ncbi:MAG: hypothetical protein IIB46_06825 [Nitrospinae bacterium]|nr:hypothetical protein [Nitrospinota bacterium]
MNPSRITTESSDTPVSPQAGWWNSRTVILALVLHGFLFLGLFSLSFEIEEWDRIKLAAKEQSIEAAAKIIMQGHGLFGFVIWFYNSHGEEQLYYRYAKLTLSGEVDYWTKNKNLKIENERPWPYRDIPIEYQPGALLTLSLPGLFADNYKEYRFWLIAWFGFLYLLNLFLGIKLVTGGTPTTVQMNRLLWWSLAFLVLLGGIVTSRFDHIVVTCVLLSTLVFGHALRKKGKQALIGFALFGFVTSVGVMTKIVPGLILISALLILLLNHKQTPRWADAFASVTGLGVGLVFLNAGFYAIFGPGYWESFTYHMDRGIQLESVYAGLLLLAQMAGLAIVTFEKSFGSSNVVSSLTGVVKLISPFLFLGILVVLVRRVWHYSLPEGKAEEPGHFVCSQIILLTLILLLAFMLSNKVFSPQYMIWVGPLMAVLVAVHKNMWKIGMMFLIASAMTQGIFPHLYEFLNQFHPAMVILLNLRNALLILILIMLIRDLPKLLEKNHSS